MSTSAKITIHDSGAPVGAIDRTYDGNPGDAGADVLRALWRNTSVSPGTVLALPNVTDEPGVLDRLEEQRSDHRRIEGNEERALYNWRYLVRYDGGHVTIEAKSREGCPFRGTSSEFAAWINSRREHTNGRLLLLTLQGSEYPFLPYIDTYGRETEERATPIISDDVAVWLDPETGSLVGRSLIAKRPRVTVNGENEPSATEMARRNGVRVEVDFGGRQVVAGDGTVYDLSEEQLEEIAEEYQRVRRTVA